MEHFVYRITVKNEFDERVYYVGKRSGLISDFKEKKYFTSSKIVSKLIKKNEYKVKIIKTFKNVNEALKFEGKYHLRLNVKNNKYFYNMQNQTLTGKLDRTNQVTVYFKNSKEKITIDVNEYYNNLEKYDYIYSGFVMAKNKENEYRYVSKEEFQKGNYVGINYDKIYCLDLRTNEKVQITKEEFQLHKEFYHYGFANKISAYDTLLDKKVQITKEEFNSSERYIGIKAFTKEKKKFCNICKKEISLSNFERHTQRHSTKLIWVTDNLNQNSFRTTEIKFFTELKDNYYIVEKNKDFTFGFVNGKKMNIRHVGRINKTLI
jgi:hypothetical protein